MHGLVLPVYKGVAELSVLFSQSNTIIPTDTYNEGYGHSSHNELISCLQSNITETG